MNGIVASRPTRVTYVFPGIWLRPTKLIMVDSHYMAIFAMQFSEVTVSITIPCFDM
jgi:hypothetical protein